MSDLEHMFTPPTNSINVQTRTLFHGDNLPFLQGINTGTINLIYADPPFNKNRDFYSDPESLAGGGGFVDRWRWNEDVHDDWVNTIKTDWPGVHAVIEAAKLAYGMDMAAFLCWLGVRIMECHRVLRDDGSMFLHIDHTAHAWVKCMMDDIFGKENFRNEVVWCYRGMPSAAKRFQQKHDTILFYAKSHITGFNVLRTEPEAGSKRTFQSAQRVGYNANHSRNMVTVFDEDKYRKAVRAGKIPAGMRETRFTGGRPPMRDWWDDIKILGGPNNRERTGYKTQKPLKLLKRIIEAASKPGDLVLDPFCGCATTPIAAEQLGRNWIGMDIWDRAHETILERLQREGLAVPDIEYRGQGDLIPFAEVKYTQAVPRRDDDMKVAVVDFELEPQAILEPWEKLRPAQMREILGKAQRGYDEFVVCAGCGRQLEDAFMELDHLQPKSLGGENVIPNRILICRPCNWRKGNKETMAGLWDANKKSGWMMDETRAKINHENALKTSRTYKRRHRH